MLCMRYLIIDRHRQRYINLAPGGSPVIAPIKDHQSVPWVTLFTKPAFWCVPLYCVLILIAILHIYFFSTNETKIIDVSSCTHGR
jgi:hypothetical protein